MIKHLIMISAAISIGACAPFQPYAERTSDRQYIVQPGDNFHSIAFLLETTPRQLRRANPWASSDKLKTGMRLSVPRSGQAASYASIESNNQDPLAYTPENIEIRGAGFIWPLNRFDVSSNFGRRRGRMHSGIDLRAPPNTEIYASADGRVKFSGYSGAYGRMIVIDHGRGIETAYAHNSRNLVKPGQRVEQGEVIARVGRTGNATGYHLHFEIRKFGRALNPVQQLRAEM